MSLRKSLPPPFQSVIANVIWILYFTHFARYLRVLIFTIKHLT